MSVAFSPDGTRIVCGSSDSTLRLWDAEERPAASVNRCSGHEDEVSSVAFSPDGTRIVAAVGTGRCGCGMRRAASPSAHRCTDMRAGLSVAFSPDGTRIVSGSWDRTLRLWPGPAGLARTLVCEAHTQHEPCRMARVGVAFYSTLHRTVPGLADSDG